MITYTYYVNGQIHGGKNNMGITRTGKHYPKKDFKEWRDGVIADLITQKLKYKYVLLEGKKNGWEFYYCPKDNRRRDVPMILDAVFHCLERAGVVNDDCIIKDFRFTDCGVSDDPYMKIEIYVEDEIDLQHIKDGVE